MIKIASSRISRLLLTLALLALALPALNAFAQSSVTVRRGERVNFTSSGFARSETIHFWLTGPNGRSQPRYPEGKADVNGNVEWSWDVPNDAAGGLWTAVARGVRNGLQVAHHFTVLAPDTPIHQVSVTPEAGPAGTTFSFTVLNLTPGEWFNPWVRGPDGRDRDIGRSGSFIRIQVGSDGRLTWEWTAPAGSLTGDWRALARGEQSGLVIEVPFKIAGVGPRVPEMRVEPSFGAPGTTFTIIVGGFNPSEAAGSWLNTPSGRRIDATPYIKADDYGVARWTWEAPGRAEAGRWQAITRGEDTRREVVLDLTITGVNPAPTPEPGPLGSVAPASGPAESQFNFAVSGLWKKDRELAYWFIDAKGAPVVIDEKIPVDEDGNANWIWTAPRLVEPGPWVMSARGKYSGLTVQVPFTITAPQMPVSTASPAAGPPGTVFTFRATGFNGIEKVDTWVERPDGSVGHGTFGVRADRDGIATWTWQAPPDAARGTWTMVVKGRDTKLILKAGFIIQ